MSSTMVTITVKTYWFSNIGNVEIILGDYYGSR